ncbi:MAG: TMEM175 family protein [Acidobacteriaceae bacterium]
MPKTLSPGRLEAFSDGVIAVIITIMVLELRVPSKEISNLDGLRALLPLLIVYLLSFVQTGIYWVNHHYLTDDLDHVTHGILWANLAFLFCLSLIPFATTWIGTRGITPFAVSLYSVICALPSVAWIVLSTAICRHTAVSLAGSPLKQLTSTALYLGAIPVAYVSPNIALCMIAAVAILWLLPPRKIRVAHQSHQTPPE